MNLKASMLNLVLSRRWQSGNRTPVMIWGPPGIGKSSVIGDAAERAGRKMYDTIRLSQMDPVDLRGLPYRDDGDNRHTTNWAVPACLPHEDVPSVLFLDEINTASMEMQAAAMQLCITPFRLGDYQLPANTFIVAAGNRLEDGAAAKRFSAALSNRFDHLDLEVDLNDWTKWAIRVGVRQELIAFLRFRPELLNAFDKANRANPTPRTWEFVSHTLESAPPRETELAEYAASVGDGAASEFTAFLRIWRDMPNLDGILMNPKTAPMPDMNATNGVAVLFAVAVGLASKATEDNMDRVIQYVARMPAEFGVLTITDATRRKPEVMNTGAFIQWAADNADVII